jgi:hypothetical protein
MLGDETWRFSCMLRKAIDWSFEVTMSVISIVMPRSSKSASTEVRRTGFAGPMTAMRV